MRNMEYCMFENTFLSLKQAQEEGNWDLNNLSESEKKYRKKLLELCRELSSIRFNWED